MLISNFLLFKPTEIPTYSRWDILYLIFRSGQAVAALSATLQMDVLTNMAKLMMMVCV